MSLFSSRLTQHFILRTNIINIYIITIIILQYYIITRVHIMAFLEILKNAFQLSIKISIKNVIQP